MKNKPIIAASCAVMLIMLCLGFIYIMPCRDECSSLSQLPVYGSEFSSRNLGRIQYTASRRTRVVLAKVNTTSQEFDVLVSKFKLNKFSGEPAPTIFDEYDKEFCPKGNRVHSAFGKMYKNSGRAMIRLYFEPNDESDSDGILYIHIS